MMVEAGSLGTNLNDPVTKHMRTDFARLQSNHTVKLALAAIRERPPEGRIIYFYVVDEDNRLQGVVPTRRLLLNADATSIKEIMVASVIAIPASATVLEACEFFLLHRLLAFPVVDSDRRLLGIVDVELYTSELSDLDRREGNDDLFQLIGVHVTESQQASSVAAFQSRFPWLWANIAGGILAAFLSGVFKAELQQTVALALFIPVVLALAESVSIQSVSLSLQSLRGRRPTWQSIVSMLRRESMTGLMLGAASALSVGLVATVWLREWRVTLCLLGGIAGGVTCAALIGVAMPSILRRLNREPQVAAGPIALAATDMATLLIYFTLARWALS
ncbi:MAG: magnesium transporter [Pirellulales bacterium]|nr:magnesium transporter [Pirellulales bacterium]MBX3433932.1 magnesium transporter [Pirellulales bacterium]